LIFWNCLLAGLTFFVDHFRFPALAALAIALVLIASLGTSDHVFSIVERTKAPAKLLRPEEAFWLAPEAVIVVAAAGGGIQSAAWTSRVLCGLRAEVPDGAFQKSVLAISGVFRRICRDDVLSALSRRARERCKACKMVPRIPAWKRSRGVLTHPDLRRVFFPGPRDPVEPGRSWLGARALTAEKRSLRADGATFE